MVPESIWTLGEGDTVRLSDILDTATIRIAPFGFTPETVYVDSTSNNTVTLLWQNGQLRDSCAFIFNFSGFQNTAVDSLSLSQGRYPEMQNALLANNIFSCGRFNRLTATADSLWGNIQVMK